MSCAASLVCALDARDVHLAFLPVDPKWDQARADARIAATLDRCGFAIGPSLRD